MQCAISRMTGLPWLRLATLGFRYTSIFLSFVLSSIHPSLSATPFPCFLFLSLHLFFSSLPFCVPHLSKSLHLPFFYSPFFQIIPVYLSTFLYPVSFPPCSLYQVLYNVGSPDVLPASLRHFDSVQLSMIMYCSLNHSSSLSPSFPISLPVCLSPWNTHAQTRSYLL